MHFIIFDTLDRCKAAASPGDFRDFDQLQNAPEDKIAAFC
jgi:hypothetical protein